MVFVIENQGIITGSVFNQTTHPKLTLKHYGIEPHEIMGISHLRERHDPYSILLKQ